jgi:ABC-type multidrug transport system ATPase subunit
MNEKLLDALMELFAIIANINDLGDKGKGVVEGFLKQNVTLDAVSHYLQTFEDYFIKHSGGKKKRTPVSHSVQGLYICSQINENLTQSQKLVILIRLLEFINLDEEITEDEYDFVETVGLAFNFSEPEYKLIRDYVIAPEPLTLAHKDIMILDANENGPNEQMKHIQHDHIDGFFCYLRVPSLDIYLVKYHGKGEANLNGLLMSQRLIYPFINGSSIKGQKFSTIYYSDVVSRFQDELSQEKMHFEAKNITYEFKGGKIGLHDVNFIEETGRLVGIMGASGAGKTTLLNVLSGISKPTYGTVTVNGMDIYDEKNKEKNKGLIGLIAQDDLLFEELTVYQNLYYNAQLCLGGFTEEEIEESVIRILKSLGLFEIKDLTVGSPLNKKISGGQRKRLNVALELIREPSVLFVDEPTSGLSSRDSENIMDLLKELTLRGKLVIVVIHQPSSEIFKMFDKLLILDTGGFSAYYGNPIDAINYFRIQTNAINAGNSICGECGNVNPEQIFNIIESKVVDENGEFTDERKVSPKKWNEIFIKNIKIPELKSKTSDDLPAIIIPSKIKQLSVFIKRDVLSKLSNSQYMTFTFAEAPLLAFILAFLVRYFDVDESGEQTYIFSDNSNIVAFLFMSVVVAIFLGMIVSAEEIIKDRKIKKREAFLNLSNGSYMFSKVMILFSISAIQTFTFVLIGNYILGIHGLTIEFWLVLFSVSCFANMLGLNISQTFNSAVTIYILIPILLIPQMILSGAIVKFDKLNPTISSQTHVPITGDIIASKWAFEALAVTQFKENDYMETFYELDKRISHYNFRIGYLYPKLRAKIDYNEKYAESKDQDKIDRMNHNLELLNNEFAKILKEFPEQHFDVNLLKIETFNFENAQTSRAYIKNWRSLCNKHFNQANDEKDALKSNLSRDELIELKRTYHNDNLDDLVRNSSESTRIIEHQGEYIQKIDPIYLDPSTESTLDYRAHLFAPTKNLFGNLVDTLKFNIIVLWIMTLLLYLCLSVEAFTRFLNSFNYIFERIKDTLAKDN